MVRKRWPGASKTEARSLQHRCQRGRFGGRGGVRGALGASWANLGSPEGCQEELLEAQGQILGGFWRSKSDKKTCFFWTSIFYEKIWFFENRAGALVKAIILKGQGRFRRSSEPTKTTKIMKKSSQKCMKKTRSKNMKNREKTEKHEKQGPLRNTLYTS